MPLIHSGSKKALKKNIEVEMEAHPDKKKQDLAIAYSVQRHAKKMSSGGEVQNEDLNPRNEPEHSAMDLNYKDGIQRGSTEDNLGAKEPMEYHQPEADDMPAGMNPDQDHMDVEDPMSEQKGRIMKAMQMSRQMAHGMAEGGPVQMADDQMYDSSLAMNDTYPDPQGKESNTAAQDDMNLSDHMDNEKGNEDQEEDRRLERIKRALGR